MPLEPVPRWAVALMIGGTLVAGVVGTTLLVAQANRARDRDTVARLRIDGVRTGLSLAAGTGGFVALLIAMRRQWLAERTQNSTEQDQQQRQVTELYTKAVEQLGSANAVVRLGSLYALERLAQENEDQRQTIVNILCACLRLPDDAVPEDPQADAPSSDPRMDNQVRLTAQRILMQRLSADDGNDEAWCDIDLDLSGTVLTGWTLTRGTLRHADFRRTLFTGECSFAGTTIARSLKCDGTMFSGPATFAGAAVTGAASFAGAQFADRADFAGLRFHAAAGFAGAKFHQRVSFAGSEFADGVDFAAATCGHEAAFAGARFRAAADFSEAKFDGPAEFDEARFEGPAELIDVVFGSGAHFSDTHFDAGVTFRAARFAGAVMLRGAALRQYASFDGVRFEDAAHFEHASITDGTFRNVQLAGVISFADCAFDGEPVFERWRITADEHHRARSHWPSGWRVSIRPGDAGATLVDDDGPDHA
ncbi:pentapeptide repeat-containing protein [Dactylosporangium sp. CS-047395]|uniref:pentapeptide repeat-containing protein n=1 Tax=Dactylosporangium sp. CS-047395 TaxID=3239936 RepID=UPI003D89B8E4